MTGRINHFRLQSSPFARKNSETREVFPLIVVSCEGTKSEYQYFIGLAKAIKSRRYQHSDVVLQVMPLPKLDTNSDPQSVIDLLEEFWQENKDDYRDAIMAAVIDRDDHDCASVIEYCREHEQFKIELFLTSPCFEFFLLLHLCDNIDTKYDLEKIKQNERISGNNTYMSNIISELTHSHKDIHFERYYLDNIPRALLNAQKYEKDLERIGNGVGTNLPVFFEILTGVRTTMWDDNT